MLEYKERKLRQKIPWQTLTCEATSLLVPTAQVPFL